MEEKIIQINSEGDNIQGRNVKNHKFYMKTNNWSLMISIASMILSLSSIIIIASVLIRVDRSIEIVFQSLIISFIGILATIVVIGNYMQTKDVERKFENLVTELQNEVSIQLKQVKEDFSNQLTNTYNNSNSKILEDKIQLYHNTLEGLVNYNSSNFEASLHSCMNALFYLNSINKSNYYSFDTPAYYIERLSTEKIKNQIKISNNMKNSYINILNDYKGESKYKLIEFIKTIKTT